MASIDSDFGRQSKKNMCLLFKHIIQYLAAVMRLKMRNAGKYYLDLLKFVMIDFPPRLSRYNLTVYFPGFSYVFTAYGAADSLLSTTYV